MQTILVSDVFGRTKALDKIASGLSGATNVFDPYHSVNMGFANEKEAYSCFTTEVGLNKYTDNLMEFIQSYSGQLNLIGFSVGASAIWKISALTELKTISSATCFYGSQIRYYKNLCPTFPVQLIFPTSEEHFSISELIANLSKKENIQIQQVPFSHGFMNSHSINYDQGGYNHFIHALCKSKK